ncbi:putative membrane protein [Leucobacter exalbidus]|uniref:Membrane protein n=1 Tax=Leucobacter exalbidus TaxID=662960 RepID=A0A940T4V5_9MICO|nr:DUF1003 domain-containing protein [Leucobacter exalbidus]MBP1327632.1 putative membrane protein [Leucobacter exalbidus]
MRLFGRRTENQSLATPLGARAASPRSESRADARALPRNEQFGRWTERIARGMGTPIFLLALTLMCVAWILWNTLGPTGWRFDSAALGFTALTLILSLQASYAAPMILLAQNRQDDRDRVQIEQDRQRAERNLADTEFLAREVVALRLALKDLPDREFLRQELRSLLAELAEDPDPAPSPTHPKARPAAEGTDVSPH